MGQRVTLEQAARLCGRAEKTIRAWLAEEPPPLSVVYGHWRGGTRGKGGKVTKGRTRLLDVAELEALNAARGGTWHAEHLPPPDVDSLAEEVAALRARIAALESARRAVYAPVRVGEPNLAALANVLPGASRCVAPVWRLSDAHTATPAAGRLAAIILAPASAA